MKLKSALSLLFILIISFGFQCRKDLIPFTYTFRAEVDIFPLKKTYSLNDTIWIETDLPNKILFDTKSAQNIVADSGEISLTVNYNEFSSQRSNPSNGLCDVITINGVNSNRYLFEGAVQTYLAYGCSKPDYRARIGFKPKYAGTYRIQLVKDQLFQSCPNKINKYNASINYRFKNMDLNADILNSLPEKERDGSAGTRMYNDLLDQREIFVFKVQ